MWESLCKVLCLYIRIPYYGGKICKIVSRFTEHGETDFENISSLERYIFFVIDYILILQ